MPRYQVERRLGAGGMAEVFQARQLGAEGFSRRVALERVLPSWSDDERFARMFISEARVASQLSHPNIVAVLDFDRDDDGCLYLTMELVPGCDVAKLRDALAARSQPLPLAIAVFICVEVLRALDHAHRAEQDGAWLGIVHRDVSPHNVLVGRSGEVKLTDFGIAKATAASTHSGMVRGKLAYMSPEQANGQPLDGRSDLFAVGVMLYELCAGGRPFDGETDQETLANVLLCRYPPLAERAPWVPADVREVAARLLRPAAADRFASAQDALRALVACRCFPADGTSALAALVAEALGPPAAPAPADTPYVGEVRGASTRTLTPSSAGAGRRALPWVGGGLAIAAGVAVALWVAPWALRRSPPGATSAAASPPAIPAVVSARPAAAAPPLPARPPASAPSSAAPSTAPVDAGIDGAVAPALAPDAGAARPRPSSSRRRHEWEIPRGGSNVIVPR